MFQANPARYDIVGAMGTGRALRWVLRQYRRDVAPGDGAVLWRSGAQRGVLGIGTVLAVHASTRDTADWEQPFVLDGSKPADGVPVAEFRLARRGFVPAEELRRDPVLCSLLVLRRPNSTVFPLTDDEWARLTALL